jgi:GNAT superfamily N-acetyltransferase
VTASFRRAAPSDLDDVVRLIGAQFVEHEIPTTGLSDALAAALAGRGDAAILLAVEPDGRAVGVAYLAFTYTIEHMGRTAWLEELYVEPAMRGGGLGTALLKAAMALAKELGARAMDLEVEASHARVMGLYEREGFKRHSRTRFARPL